MDAYVELESLQYQNFYYLKKIFNTRFHHIFMYTHNWTYKRKGSDIFRLCKRIYFLYHFYCITWHCTLLDILFKFIYFFQSIHISTCLMICVIFIKYLSGYSITQFYSINALIRNSLTINQIKNLIICNHFVHRYNWNWIQSESINCLTWQCISKYPVCKSVQCTKFYNLVTTYSLK